MKSEVRSSSLRSGAIAQKLEVRSSDSSEQKLEVSYLFHCYPTNLK